ncbi:MAG: DUF2948 family protein [Hyphomicrobiaceae bacterium]
MEDLKLIAMDVEDLGVVSAHLQDAILKVADLAYQPREKRLVALVNRFNWTGALRGSGKAATLTRHRAALRVDRVRSARIQKLNLKDADQVLSLMTLQFEQAAPNDPAGQLTLIFAGGSAIQLDVECIEIELRDLGGAWAARSQPKHDSDEGSPKN